MKETFSLLFGFLKSTLKARDCAQRKAFAQVLKSYFEYYHRSRTHLSLAKDAPEPRAKQPPELGTAIEIAEVGGLHHRYERRAA